MTSRRTALVSGITGQDGSYLAELLLEKGYRVVGTQRPGSKSVTRISHEIIGREAVHSQGMYSDGWASTRVRYMLPPGNGRYVEIAVTLPPGPLERQSIVVRNGRTVLARESFGTGTFRLNVPVPQDLWDSTLSFTIEAARHFVPEGADKRRLCYILERVGFSERYQLPAGS